MPSAAESNVQLLIALLVGRSGTEKPGAAEFASRRLVELLGHDDRLVDKATKLGDQLYVAEILEVGEPSAKGYVIKARFMYPGVAPGTLVAKKVWFSTDQAGSIRDIMTGADFAALADLDVPEIPIGTLDSMRPQPTRSPTSGCTSLVVITLLIALVGLLVI